MEDSLTQGKLSNGKKSEDKIAKDLISKLNGSDDGVIRQVAALMPYEDNAEYIVGYRNKERKIIEILGGGLRNDDMRYDLGLERERIEEFYDSKEKELKLDLDQKFHQKLGISPPIIGDIFGKYLIQDIKRGENGEVLKVTKRLFYVFYVEDYGELPEKPLDPKYDKIELIHFPTYCERVTKENDLSPLVIKVCEDLVTRIKKEGYQFKLKKSE